MSVFAILSCRELKLYIIQKKKKSLDIKQFQGFALISLTENHACHCRFQNMQAGLDASTSA